MIRRISGLRKALAAAALAAAMAAGARADAPAPADFFRPPEEDPAAELPENEVFPRGRLFPFSFYSMGGGGPERRGELLPEEEVQAALRRFKEHHVTMIGPQYELNDRVLKDAAEHGFKANYMIGMGKDAVRSGELTDEQIREYFKEKVLEVAEDENLAWWNIRPEELRHWRRAEIGYLELAVEAIREHDPLKRPIWMYDPGHRSAGGMSHIARHTDIVAKGMYTNYSGRKEERVWCRWTIEQQIEALKRAESEGWQIAVPEMFRPPEEEERPLVPAWVRHDAYCAMVAGAQGMVVFSASLRPSMLRDGFNSHELYLSNWLQVAKELCGELNLGQVFLFGERREELKMEVVEGLKTVTMTHRSAGVREPLEYPSLSWADIAYGEHRYLIAVNSSGEKLTAELTGLPEAGVVAADLFEEGEPFAPEGGKMTVEFGVWGVRGFRFSAQE